jgi:hypothetical protein
MKLEIEGKKGIMQQNESVYIDMKESEKAVGDYLTLLRIY